MYTKLLALLLICTLIKQSKAARKVEAFTCVGKVIGGYYTDVQSGCQMFHVCTLDGKGELQDIVFRCIDGTVFEQETRVCEREEEVNCETSEDFFYLNNELYGPGIIPDTANDNSFKTGQVKTLNGPITRPIDSQSNLTTSRSGFLGISHPTSTWSTKISMTGRHSEFSCDSKPKSSFYADEQFGCNVFHLCIELKSGRLKLKESHACSNKDAWFNEKIGRCVTALPSTCGNSNMDRISNKMIQGSPKGNIMTLCKSIGFKGLIPNVDSNCRQYIRCDKVDGKLFAKTYRCKSGFSFSSKHKTCIKSYKNKCELGYSDTPSKHQFDLKGHHNARFRRSSQFENHNNHRESSSGSLTRSSAIFSDHASVIDNPSPGNIVIEGSSMPKKEKKDKFNSDLSSAFKPHMSHAKNQTIRNGTLVEISEISSPDQGGKVTITSIVPKFIRLNGSNQPNYYESSFIPPGISVSSIQSKVTFSGVNASASDSDFQKESDDKLTAITNTFGNESMSVNETVLESDTLSTNNLDYDSSTVAITTVEPTKYIEESTTHQMKIETTVSPISKSTPDTLSPTKIDGIEMFESNFTCKDKELERFYPDLEAGCRVFHYCAPGFSVDQVLDLKFICTGDTRFDSATSKCQNKTDVVCETPTVYHGLTTPGPESSSLKVTSPQPTSTTSLSTQAITTESTTLSTQKSTSVSASTQKSTTVSTSTQKSTTVSTSTQDSTSVSTSTQKSTTVSTSTQDSTSVSTSTQASSIVASSLSTSGIVTSQGSSISFDTDATSEGTDFTEKTSSIPTAESSTESSLENSVKPFDQEITSTVSNPEISELSSSPSSSTITPTSKASTEEINTQHIKDDSTVEISKEVSIAPPLNTEKALLSNEKETNPKNEVTNIEETYSNVVNETSSTQNITQIANSFEYGENTTIQIEFEDSNTTIDNLMEWNISSIDGIDELSLQSISTAEEINSTEASIISIVETSTPYEYKNYTSSPIIEEYADTDVIISTFIESDIITESSLSPENVTSIAIPT